MPSAAGLQEHVGVPLAPPPPLVDRGGVQLGQQLQRPGLQPGHRQVARLGQQDRLHRPRQAGVVCASASASAAGPRQVQLPGRQRGERGRQVVPPHHRPVVQDGRRCPGPRLSTSASSEAKNSLTPATSAPVRRPAGLRAPGLPGGGSASSGRQLGQRQDQLRLVGGIPSPGCAGSGPARRRPPGRPARPRAAAAPAPAGMRTQSTRHALHPGGTRHPLHDPNIRPGY